MASSSIRDAIVVGAGPAGATAARTLAAAGVDTLLIDRATFPRAKACGGAITTRVLGRFPYLGAALGRISTHWISKLALQSPAGEIAHLASSAPAVLTIRRIEFDALLVDLARETGADVAEDVEIHDVDEQHDRVRLRTRDGRTLDARMVVAADGVHGVVAKRLGLLQQWRRDALAVDLMEETPTSLLRACDPDALWVSYGCPASIAGGPPALTDGYAYVFPKRTHVNVGIGYLAQQYRTTYRGNPYALQRGLIDRLTRDGILAGRSCRSSFTPFLIPVGGPLPRTGTRRTLVAGDAGGFVNGFSAEGIYYAMVSGELAGTSIARALANGTRPDARYRTRWWGEIGPELEESVVLQRFLFEDGRRIEAMVAGAAAGGAIVDAVIRWAGGADKYSGLRRSVVFRNPLAGLVLGARLLRARAAATPRGPFSSQLG